jgi:hypothetical protein
MGLVERALEELPLADRARELDLAARNACDVLAGHQRPARDV